MANTPNIKRINDQDVINNSRELSRTEETLANIRRKHESELKRFKELNQANLTKQQLKDLEKWKDLSIEVAKSANSYRKQLQEKYARLIQTGLKTQAQAEKEIATDVYEYTRIQQAKLDSERRINDEKWRYSKLHDLQDIANAEISNISKIHHEQRKNDIERANFRELLRNQELHQDIDFEKKRSEITKAEIENRYSEQELQKAKLENILTEYALEMDLIAQKRKSIISEAQAGKKSRKEKREELKEVRKREKELNKETAQKMRDEGATSLDIMQKTKTISASAIGEAVFSNQTASAIANNLINGIKQMFDNTIQTYGEYQRRVNVRVQGTETNWRKIERTLKYDVGSTPWLKTQQMMDNVVKATEQGIVFNIEQRAFLATIKDSIAATFDAFDSNLTRIIKLQQADSTAARLGLEANLTQFLNTMYQDSSYLTNSFDTVSHNLIEATSQMTAEQAVSFEYQVQKWLGSLSSVGFSDQALNAISEAIGNLGSGNVSALAGSGTLQNLLVMSASRANLNYSDLLIKGLNESNTNKLLQSMVTYLQEIANSDNKVVKSEYARIFGMNVSDLSAVKNLIGSVSDIAKSTLDYSSAITEVYNQLSFGNMAERVGIGGMLQNLMSNTQYAMGSSIAANPVTYALWEMTSMIEDLTGGIALPTFSVMGNMVDLNTTVTNLMRAGIVGVNSLGAIGQIISGIGSTVAPSSILSKLGVDKNTAKQTNRGSGLNRKLKVLEETSGSTFIGNTSGDDYYESTMTSANDTTEKQLDQKKEEQTDITLNNMHEYLLRVFDPKFTELERLVALIAGYSSQTKTDTTLGSFKGQDKKEYVATKVVISQDQVNNKSNQLESINDSVSSIREILEKGVITVKYDMATTTTTTEAKPGF